MSEEIQMETPSNLQEVKGSSIKDFLKEYKYETLLILICFGVIVFKLWNNHSYFNFMNYFVNKENPDNIDLVYTWVDGSDKNWLEKKNKYSINRTKINDNTRFTSIDELKYSLRGVYKYSQWINNIYIVVDDDQKPNWLNLNHPKIHLIKHSQIFENKEDLPTFNSHSIESNLHNIPGLSENYLYLNDDMFFGNHTTKNDFISIGGKLSYYSNRSNCLFNLDSITESKYNGYYGAWNKSQSLLYEQLNIKPRCQWHFAIILKKSHFTEVKNIFPEEFKNTSKSKFRNKTDIVPNGIAYQYGLNKGDYEIKRSLSNSLVDARYDPKYIFFGLRNILETRPKIFCINNVTNYNPTIIQFLDLYYPNKSPYEI